MYTAPCLEVGVKTEMRIAWLILLAMSPAPTHSQAAGTASKKSVEPQSVEQYIEAVESCLPPPVIVKCEPKSCRSLSRRMEELHVAGLSIAVVHNGRVEWAKGYGVRQIGGDSVNADTLFQ